MLRGLLRFGCVATLIALLAACGGGGGGGGGQATNQTFAFTTPGAVTGAVGTTVANTAVGGGGTGSVTYASSNLVVATVNPTTGAATLLTVGSTTITATKAASSGFNQATASYTLNATAGQQSIAFAQGGPVPLLVGAVANNSASGGSGSGAITYATSNTAVVTLNSASGAATAVGVGSATITATKAADNNYQQAQATYTVTVTDTAAVNAWVGANDSQVTLPAVANGARFIRSRDRNCNPANFSVCTSGQMNIVSGAPATTITDTAATTVNTGYYTLQTDTVNSNPRAVNVNRFSERIGHGALFFNNRYWVIGGGYSASANARADVWSSVDGKTWELETSTAHFGGRWLHQSVVYNNKLWVISGVNTGNFNIGDAWSSTDGANWTQVTASLPFTALGINLRIAVFNDGTGNAMWAIAAGNVYRSTDGATWTQQSTNVPVGGAAPRAYASLTSYAGKLWYIGGVSNFTAPPNPASNAVNEVWSSPDGLTWTQQPTPPFGGRIQHASFVLNNRLWVFGGQPVVAGVVQGSSADAYSTDGTTWQAEALNTEIDRAFHVAPVLNETNKVTLIGGILRGWSNKVHQSTDGNSWTELSPYAQFTPRVGSRAVSFLGDLWVIAGATLNEIDNNDIWRSSDGLNWTRITPTTPIFSARDNHQTLVFNNRLWVIGGWGNSVAVGGTGLRLNDVWSSADGVVWRQEKANADFSPRNSFGAAVFDTGTSGSRMWVIGGETGTNTFANDVWSSGDGVNWTQVTASANFSQRGGHSVVAFNGELWLTGGGNAGFVDGTGTTLLADVWKSSNGSSWTPVTPVTSFSARAFHGSTVHNNRLWVIGGTGPSIPGRMNDVWSTVDGVNWNQETPSAQFSSRTTAAVTTHNNELWVISGTGLDRSNDVWRSADGVNWRVGFSHAIRMQ